MTPTIKFERVVRDCPANDHQTDPRKRINDFNVLIDGEHRAIFKRVYLGKGYELHDADARPLCGYEWRKHIGFAVDKQAHFEATIQDKLASIPTLAQMAALRAAEAAEKARQEAAEAEDRRVRRIQAAGVELYEALKACVTAMQIVHGLFDWRPLRSARLKVRAWRTRHEDPQAQEAHAGGAGSRSARACRLPHGARRAPRRPPLRALRYPLEGSRRAP
jgi:hypothetical protein